MAAVQVPEPRSPLENGPIQATGDGAQELLPQSEPLNDPGNGDESENGAEEEAVRLKFELARTAVFACMAEFKSLQREATAAEEGLRKSVAENLDLHRSTEDLKGKLRDLTFKYEDAVQAAAMAEEDHSRSTERESERLRVQIRKLQAEADLARETLRTKLLAHIKAENKARRLEQELQDELAAKEQQECKLSKVSFQVEKLSEEHSMLKKLLASLEDFQVKVSNKNTTQNPSSIDDDLLEKLQAENASLQNNLRLAEAETLKLKYQMEQENLASGTKPRSTENGDRRQTSETQMHKARLEARIVELCKANEDLESQIKIADDTVASYQTLAKRWREKELHMLEMDSKLKVAEELLAHERMNQKDAGTQTEEPKEEQRPDQSLASSMMVPDSYVSSNIHSLAGGPRTEEVTQINEDPETNSVSKRPIESETGGPLTNADSIASNSNPGRENEAAQSGCTQNAAGPGPDQPA